MPSPPIDPPLSLPFIQALAALGWIEGKTIQIERRYVGDTADQVATPKARAKEIIELRAEGYLYGVQFGC